VWASSVRRIDTNLALPIFWYVTFFFSPDLSTRVICPVKSASLPDFYNALASLVCFVRREGDVPRETTFPLWNPSGNCG